MSDMLAAAAVFALVVAIGLTGLFACTVVPFVLTLRAAQRRGLPAARPGLLAVAGSGVALLLALVALRAGAQLALLLAALAVAFVVPALITVSRGEMAVLGRAGRHERGSRHATSIEPG